MISKYSTFTFLLILFHFSTSSQIIITGTVLDAKTKSSLEFATVQYSKYEGVITNENGGFQIKSMEAIKSLQVSYIGYQTIEVPITNPDKPIEILLQQNTTSIQEIVVKAKDLYASNLLFRSVKKSRKEAKPRHQSKLFRRTYSYRESRPAEFMEAFYNVKTRDGGIDFFELKNGRFGIPNDSSFLNIDLTELMQVHKLFTNEFDYLPASPLEYTSLRKLRKDFDIRIRNKYAVENDTIIEISFEPLRKKNILFEGKVWIKQSSLVIEKVTLQAIDTKRNPFKTVIDPIKNKVANLDFSLNIGFKYHDQKTVFDYIQIKDQKTIVTPRETYKVNSNTKLVFYDYEKLFQTPFFSEFSEAYHDYEKILFFPYDKEFWDRNFLISETADEEKFRKELESKNLFKNQNGETALLIERRFERWNKDWEIIPELVSEREIRPGHRLDEVIFINQEKAPPRNNLSTKTFIFLDYECYSDTVIFKTEAVIDYRFSFTIHRNKIDFKCLEDFLHLTKIYASELQNELEEKYSKNNICPDREELALILNEKNKLLTDELKWYKVKIHSGLSEKRAKNKKIKKASIEIKKRLEEVTSN
ncbi:MAG: carboxypeptidase-like regulatory domain-containing protein [Saprospiraceae bacterium]